MAEPLAVDSEGNELLRWSAASTDRLPLVDTVVPMPLSLMVATRGTEVLIVYNRRRGCWELPGGMIEPGEGARHAAEREFLEETGQPCRNVHPAGVATFRLRPDHRLEHAAVFRGEVHNPVPFEPTEEIEQIAWWTGSPLRGMAELDAFIARAVAMRVEAS